MGSELPAPGISGAVKGTKKRAKWNVFTIFLATCALLLGISHLGNLGARTRYHVVPINAQEILSECAALNNIPRPPRNFWERRESDRYEPDTLPTLITNATIWTGGESGKEVIHQGEIFLDKGIIKYVGDRAPDSFVSDNRIRRINARLAWVTPSIVDMHSHLGVSSSPYLDGSADTNSHKGITQPWLRSLDSIDTHDEAYPLSVSGGVSTSLILPGSANAIGGQAFVIKLRPTKERSTFSRVLEPPYNLLNATHVDPSIPPRWRHMKHAAGENPSRVYSGTRMDTIWAFRSAYNEARKIKIEQDEYCAKAQAGLWTGLPAHIPESLKWEALVDVLRGKVKVNVHIYETVDFTGIVGLSNEFEFPIAAFHHAHEAYLVPDVIKKTWGGVPAVAMFATNARYKRESYRGSEFAAKILHENGIRVAMKSDHFVLDSRFLLYEATQAHYWGLEAPVALAAVTSTPADLIGMGHRIGYLKKGYDADVAIWDSHPLALGATPQQVFIDGIAQLTEPNLLTKPKQLQTEPPTPNWDKEAKEALKYEGLPPLDGKKIKGKVAFVNVNELVEKDASGSIRLSFVRGGNSRRKGGGVVIVLHGRILCAGTSLACPGLKDIQAENIVDLHGGSIAPGLTTFGAGIGVVEIAQEPSANDGTIFDPIRGTVPAFLRDTEIHAIDGIAFSGRHTLLAYRSGVTGAITSPSSDGVFGGLSAGFFTGASHRLEDHAILSRAAALHAKIGNMGRRPSVSTQIAALRKALSEGFKGERGKWYKQAAEGRIPLVVDVSQADHIASLLELKREIDAQTGKSLRLVLVRATEAHLLAKEIAEAGVGVILIPTRTFPATWEQRRTLPGPPLTPQSAIGVLTAANVTLGLGIEEEWQARNQRFDLAWAALESNGTLSRAEAISLGSSNLETLLGLETQHDLVAYKGGDMFELSSRVAGVISPKRGFVDLF